MTGEEPTSARLQALENAVTLLLDRAADHERLAIGVDRLGVEAEALNRLLRRVDEQQTAITRIEATAVSDVEVQATVDARAALDRHARRRALRNTVATFAVFVPIAAYVAINVHEVYRDRCDATLQAPAPWCDRVFLLDESNDNAGNPLQQAVAASIDASRKTCEDGNERARAQAAVLRGFAAEGGPGRDRLEAAAIRIELTVADCLRLFPQVEVEGGHH